MPIKKTGDTNGGAEFEGCTPFPLVKKRGKRRRKNANPDESPHWLGGFESDLKMVENEARDRLASYNAEIRDLFDHSLAGDELAAALLLEYASGAIQALEQVANRKPEVFHPISVHQIRWPAFIGTKEFHKDRNRDLIEKLKLGHKSPFTNKWNPKSPATFTAYSMLYWLLENEAVLQLPPLSKSTIDEWFEIGWNGFSESLNGQPEKYPYLREKIEQHAHKESARKQEKRKKETIIRTKMKDAVRQSFKSVTRKLPL
jgi:hypothetical protein